MLDVFATAHQFFGCLDIKDTKTNHAWNEAFVDGKWIILDTTWDSFNYYENRKYIKADKIGDKCASLTSFEIHDNITSIGDSAFSGCKSLTSIEIPDSVTDIGFRAFAGCSPLFLHFPKFLSTAKKPRSMPTT